jgi:hypothetical protein
VDGVDATIVSRLGKLTPGYKSSAWTAALVNRPLPNLVVLSLRLSPPVFRLDYWNPECWRAYAENRRVHREELADISSWISGPITPPFAIVAGDFNWTPDREIGRLLGGRFHPLSKGSGYTAVNDYPMARIDQIWVTEEFWGTSEAITTRYSDHRMVVGKIWLKRR